MTGWIIAIALACLTLGALRLSGRCPRLALELAAAFLLVALAGYGWQGSPDLAGRSVTLEAQP
ncbi:MAG: hypothetical protein KGM49_03270 [Sphingomonadales bacterium]|nr:hypothetical protein [Sphingomonadales bacterium]